MDKFEQSNNSAHLTFIWYVRGREIGHVGKIIEKATRAFFLHFLRMLRRFQSLYFYFEPTKCSLRETNIVMIYVNVRIHSYILFRIN